MDNDLIKEKEIEITFTINEDMQHPFDLLNGPLFKTIGLVFSNFNRRRRRK